MTSQAEITQQYRPDQRRNRRSACCIRVNGMVVEDNDGNAIGQIVPWDDPAGTELLRELNRQSACRPQQQRPPKEQPESPGGSSAEGRINLRQPLRMVAAENYSFKLFDLSGNPVATMHEQPVDEFLSAVERHRGHKVSLAQLAAEFAKCE